MHIVVNGWFAGQPSAGSGQYTARLLEHLPRHAPAATITLLIPRPGPDSLPAAFPGISVAPLALPSLPENWRKLWWEQVTVPAAAARLRADVLWVPYWASPLWQPCPVAVTVHDLIPILLPAYRGGWLQRSYSALVRHTATRAAAILTVSQASAADIVAHLGVPPARVHVVHHGPNTGGRPSPTPEQLAAVAAAYHLPTRFFLYLGGFDVRKNVAHTLAAYRRYLDQGGDPAVKLVLAGVLPTHDSAFAPDPRRMAAELDLGDQIHYCGWVDEADKPGLYALSTGFVFPSLYEGFGMMLLEAMAAGTPVITSGP